MFIPLWLLIVGIVVWGMTHDDPEQAEKEQRRAWTTGHAFGRAKLSPTLHQDAYLTAEAKKRSS